MSHPTDTDLSLYAGGDLGFFARRRVRAHLTDCARCKDQFERFASAREALRSSAVLPAGLDWERLSSEMTANIHLGLEAGECVAPKISLPDAEAAGYAGSWQRPAVVFAGAMIAVFLAWFVYTQNPAPEIAGLREPAIEGPALGGMVAESSASAIELNENGHGFGLRHSADMQVIGVSLQGAVQSRYVDSETGQVTINNVYVQ